MSHNIILLYSVTDILGPVILETQQKLAQRVQLHSRQLQHNPIDPAAHLDTKSYDIYGKVGFSLGLTNVPPVQAMPKPPANDGQDLLQYSRKLASQYLNERGGSCISVGDIEHVTDGYKEAIRMLLDEGRVELAAEGMHELGNLMYSVGQLK